MKKACFKVKCLLIILAIPSATIILSVPARGQTSNCPNPPTATISSPTVPDDVCIPSGFGGLPIAFFDDYSWRSFIALVWPAQQRQRGQADTSQSVSGTAGSRVFETFKSEWELFNGQSGTPSAWDAFDGPNPCNAQGVGFNDLILGSFSFSKFGNLGEAGFGNLVGPLVAQNRTYVRYSTGFNQVEYTQILRDKLYLKENLSKVVFANGSLDVKSSWIDLTGVLHPERYYSKKALLLDPSRGVCDTKAVGLVGIHIVQKTKSRPQWIWSSFEQIDNVPPSHGSPVAFNDGSGTSMPKENPYPFPPTFPTSPPYNVERLTPINLSTQHTNAVYQKLLAGSVWQFYQLVTTQWPVAQPPESPTVDPTQDGTPAHTFPGRRSDGSAFANATMETFDQTDIKKGCMNCHNTVRQNSDFVWSLVVNSEPTSERQGARDVLRNPKAPREAVSTA